ncbi:serine/threonine-protein kinase [Archangium sp.]|uniref:serine/threonine-protein kinase n=1 Tax=Archangium sp. TaxID=1872627 RepID=UPI00286BFA40|nr:serine/threonine-protein kinase [Archangium sp.]
MSRPSSPDSSQRGVPPVVLDAGLAQFELVRPLGQGHHGELLLTRQRYHQHSGGYTVLKRLNRVARQEDYQRLVEEARLGGQLHHPNIVFVQQLSGTAEEPFLLVEYVEGDVLGDLMRLASGQETSLSEAFCCHVTAEVAEGLGFAHALADERGRPLGVVHRHVTPQGIVVSRHGEVKLMDFGAAWSRLEGRISTEGDSDVGPLAYSSPERAMLEQLDGRSDLFSLGIVLLQLLTGRHLFEATARHEAELRSRQLRARGDFPGADRVPGLEELGAVRTHELTRRIRKLTPQQVQEATRGLPEGLRSILHRALAPRQQDRYGTATEMAQELREYLWTSSPRYGRLELKAEVSALHAAALKALVPPPSGTPKRGAAASRRRRKAAPKES